MVKTFKVFDKKETVVKPFKVFDKNESVVKTLNGVFKKKTKEKNIFKCIKIILIVSYQCKVKKLDLNKYEDDGLVGKRINNSESKKN